MSTFEQAYSWINLRFLLEGLWVTLEVSVISIVLSFIIGLILGAIVTIVILYKSVKAFKTTIQIFLMHVPIIKDVIIYNELTIFSKTFASLLRNNVFITDSMDILSRITNNEVYRAILYRTINNIIKKYRKHLKITGQSLMSLIT